jgi:cytochrome P450
VGPVAGLLDEWDRGPATTSFDFHTAIKHAVFRISGLTLFGRDLGAEADEATRAFGDSLAEINARIERTYALPMAVPTPGNLRLKRAIRVLDRHVQDIVDRRGNEDGADILASLLRARRDRPDEVTDRQLRDEILTLYLAGHDATSHTLSWVFHFAALYSDVQERMRDEGRQATQSNAHALPDVARLPYTTRVVQESLRVMPPASILARQVVDDDEIDGVRLPAGSWVVLSPYVTQHLPEFWPDPERFDPDRFTPERSANRPPTAYCPFGIGPRTCIGNHLAMAEIATIAAMILPRYELSHTKGTRAKPIWRATLQPKDGLSLVRRRVTTAVRGGSSPKTVPTASSIA